MSTTILKREGFSLLGETGPPKGEETALPTTLSGLGSCPRSLLDLRGWGSSGGEASWKPSLWKQQSLNAKIRDEIIRSVAIMTKPSLSCLLCFLCMLAIPLFKSQRFLITCIIILLLGDFNARLGNAADDDDVISNFGEDMCNTSGNKLISLLREVELVACKSWRYIQKSTIDAQHSKGVNCILVQSGLT